MRIGTDLYIAALLAAFVGWFAILVYPIKRAHGGMLGPSDGDDPESDSSDADSVSDTDSSDAESNAGDAVEVEVAPRGEFITIGTWARAPVFCSISWNNAFGVYVGDRWLQRAQDPENVHGRMQVEVLDRIVSLFEVDADRLYALDPVLSDSIATLPHFTREVSECIGGRGAMFYGFVFQEEQRRPRPVPRLFARRQALADRRLHARRIRDMPGQ